MEVRGFLQNPRFSRAIKIYFALGIILLILNMPFIVGDKVFWYSNSLLSPAAALVTSFLFFRARAMVKDPSFRLLWLAMGLGFALWGMADIIWAVYALVLQQEIPNPSIADIIWTVGYIPLFLALIIRLRTATKIISRRQLWLMGTVILAWLVCDYVWGIAPLLAAYDPARWQETLAALFYAIGDLGLVILSSIILILLRGGRYTISWRLMIIGIFLMTISDMLFANATLQGSYYAQEQVNLITFLADSTYLLAYLASGFGVFIYTWTWEIRETFQMRVVITPSKKYLTFIATNGYNQIITASNNLYCLFNASEETVFYKMPLEQVLGLDAATVQSIISKIAANGSVYNEPVHLMTMSGTGRQALVSAIAIYEPGSHTFSGANIALQSDLHVPEALRTPWDKEISGMLRHLLNVTSPHSKEECEAMRAYFLETIRLYMAMLYQHGGTTLQTAFLDEINQESRHKNLSVEISDEAVYISEDFEGEDLATVLMPLLQAARRFVSNIIGEQIVNDKLNELKKQFSSAHLASVEKYQLNLHSSRAG